MTAGWLAPGSMLLFLCLLLPWLNPYAPGPSAAVAPWLFSAMCVGMAFGLRQPPALRPSASLGLVCLAAWVMLRTGLSLDSVAVVAACLLVFMAGSVASQGQRDDAVLRAVALAWLMAALMSTAIAVVQYFGAAELLAPWIDDASAGQALGNLRQRNQFASLTVIGMASLFYLVPRHLGLGPALAAIALLAVGNAASTSRTGLVQLLALAALAWLWPGDRSARRVLWTAGLLAYGVAAMALPGLLEWMTGLDGSRLWERVAGVSACSSRRVLWSNVLELVAARPWLGWGWGELDYAHFATLYEGPRFCDILDNAHNLPLHLAVELGLPAALLGCAAVAWAVAWAAPWRESDAARQMAWAVLAVLAVHSLVEYPLWYGPFQLALGLCLGLLLPARAVPEGGATPRRAAALVTAAGVLVACGYAAWDYRRVSQIYLPPESRAKEYRVDPLPIIRDSWLFSGQARFGELSITPLTRDNAAWTFDSAQTLLHYSPEPRVIEKLIESALVLGREDEVLHHLVRFRAAFPEAHEAWSREHSGIAAAAMAR